MRDAAAMDAIALLENLNLKVKGSWNGKVKSQCYKQGRIIVKHDNIELL
jgi:hypothetical protein